MATMRPSDVSGGSLDMTLRELLVHMLDKRLDHVVLIPAIPGGDVQISVTVAGARKTREITAAVGQIVKGSSA